MLRLSPKFRSQRFFVCKICIRETHTGDAIWRRQVREPGGRKLTETTVTAFCYKSANLSLEELKNIRIMYFPTQELFR